MNDQIEMLSQCQEYLEAVANADFPKPARVAALAASEKIAIVKLALQRASIRERQAKLRAKPGDDTPPLPFKSQTA